MIEHLAATLATAEAGRGAAQHVPFAENLEFLLVGLLIVMGTLTALWGLCELMGAAFKWQAARAAEKARLAVAEPAAAVPAPQVEAPPIVVIAAAVAAVVDQPHRVVEVRPASVAWSLEGRRQLLSSHKLPR